MKPNAIRFDLLFDAYEYLRCGSCPWTFFAYPTSLADGRGLPPDAAACDLVVQLQQRGINVAIWANGIAEDTTYFACRQDQIHRLYEVLQELEASGIIERDFCGIGTERLFAMGVEHESDDR